MKKTRLTEEQMVTILREADERSELSDYKHFGFDRQTTDSTSVARRSCHSSSEV